MFNVKNQTVLITGASSGIGRACAERFAALGANLIVTARRLYRLEELSQELTTKYGIRCLCLPFDIQKKDNIAAAFAEIEKQKWNIDLLINNAGLALSKDKLQEGEVTNWETMIDTNIKGLLYVTRAALPFLLKKNAGHIVNIGSIAGRSCYVGGNVYCATKFAVKALSQSLRLDLLGTNIRVSEIAPGAVETEFSNVRLHDAEAAKKVYAGYVPLVADDIADAIVYCVTRPAHVNISEMVIYPQAQASPTEVYRKNS